MRARKRKTAASCGCKRPIRSRLARRGKLRLLRLPPHRPSRFVNVVSSRSKRTRPGGATLGGVDGFDQDKGTGERNEDSEVLRRLLAAQGDALEALDLADALLLGASAPLV